MPNYGWILPAKNVGQLNVLIFTTINSMKFTGQRSANMAGVESDIYITQLTNLEMNAVY